jgi:N utilization substance protein A
VQIEDVNDVLTSKPQRSKSSRNKAPRVSDTHKIVSTEPQHLSEQIDEDFDAMRKELGIEDGLKDIPGVTTPMLIALGEHGIKTIEDLADCATDDLDGWSEFKDGKTTRHAGILEHFRVSRQDCEAIIMNARTKAGWFK